MVRETQRPGVTAWVGGTHVVFQVAQWGDPLFFCFSRRTAPVVKGGRKPEALATTFFLQPLA